MCVLQLDRTIFFFGKGLVNDFTANILVQKAETGKISHIGVHVFVEKEDEFPS